MLQPAPDHTLTEIKSCQLRLYGAVPSFVFAYLPKITVTATIIQVFHLVRHVDSVDA